MLYCFDDLILPSTLPATNIDLDTDTMLATVSPVHYQDLSLSSSCRSQSPSDSSSSTNSVAPDVDFDIDMAFQGDEEAARSLIFPASHQSYYSQPQAMPSHQMLYRSPPASLPGNQSWMSLPLFAQQQSFYNHALPSNDIFSSFDTNLFSSGGGVIPPTPQATEGPSFFNAFPSQPQRGYLTTAPSHTTSYSGHESHTTSISSSLSRSCSPAPITCTAPATTFPSSAPSYPHHLTSTPQSTQPLPSSQSSTSLHPYGIPVPSTSPSTPQAWRCAYPNCSSRALFTRGCDLRKHFNRHSKHLFCRVKGCPQSAPRTLDAAHANGIGRRLGGVAFGAAVGGGGGFSSKKDRVRHEAKHNPRILCEWIGADGGMCGRKFSRVDNMKDHVRRIHRKGQVEAGAEGGRLESGMIQEEGIAGAEGERLESGMIEEEEEEEEEVVVEGIAGAASELASIGSEGVSEQRVTF